jgi:hypothetical protein
MVRFFLKKLLNVKCVFFIYVFFFVKCVFWFSLQLLSKNISHSKKNSARYCRKCENVKNPLFFSDLKETRISSTHFQKKSSNFEFHQDSSSGSRVVPCRRTDGRVYITKLIIAFRNFAIVLKILLQGDQHVCCGPSVVSRWTALP